MLHWYRTKTDVDVHLPDLTTYLGHGHVKDTYWYLSAMPELLKLATLRLQPKEVA
jgi:integrase/recombinase XerD